MDDTLVQYLDAFLKEWARMKWQPKLHMEDMHIYDPCAVAGLSRKEGYRRLHHFETSDAFINMRPAPGAMKAVLALALRYTPVIITSRATHCIRATETHLERYFPACKELWFADNGKGSLMYTPGRATKAALCRDLRCEIAVEDSLKQAVKMAKYCRAVYLLKKRWNRTTGKLPGNLVPVASLHDVVEAECGTWARKALR
jgi:hypothetical protein